MHSAGMSRRKAALTQANVGIGTPFTPKDMDLRDTRSKIHNWNLQHGIIPINAKSRLIALHRNWKAGKMSLDVAANVYRQNKKAFDAMDKEAAK